MIPATKNPLTDVERARLAELEPVVKMGMANFVVVGKALLEISDSRLYRERYATFAEYVQAEYEMSVSRAYQYCHAAEVVKSLPQSASTFVDTEAKARAFRGVPKDARLEVLRAAKKQAKSEKRDVIANDIEVAAETVAPKHIQTDVFKKLARGHIAPDITPLSAFTRLVDDAMAVIPANESPVLPYRMVLEDRAARLANRDQESKNKTAYA